MRHSGPAGFKWLPVALASLVLCNGCSFLPRFSKLSGNRAFIDYWPPDPNSKGLRLAVKDNIDMKGVITTAGSEIFSVTHKPAEEDAPCLAIARQRHVQIVGKTNMSEFAVSPSGMNEYFGTAVNPLKRRLIPGGSSSGNAVALASGAADVAFGTDTAGSIRIPAACCGIVGLKTTFGLIPIEGVYPVEEHLDTVGPMGRDIDHTVQGMELLQDGFAAKYASAKAAKPTARSIRVGRLKLKGTDPKIDQAIDDALSGIPSGRAGRKPERTIRASEEGRHHRCLSGRVDQRRAISDRCDSSNPVYTSTRSDKLYHELPRRIGQARCVAEDAT
jgi:amidase